MINILRAVSKVTGVSERELLSKKRDGDTAEARGIFCAICVAEGRKRREIGAFLNRESATVNQIGWKYIELCDTDQEMWHKREAVLSKMGNAPRPWNGGSVLNGSLWDDDYYVVDASSRYFGECYVGMVRGNPVCRGGFYRVVNEMLERRKNGR